MSCQDGKPNPQTTPKAVYLSPLKAKRSDCDIAEMQKENQIYVKEYCFVGFKNTFPCYVVFAAGTARGREIQTEIALKRKNKTK